MNVPAGIAKRERLWRKIFIVIAIAALLGCAARAILKPDDGDFKLHRETGRRFLAGEFLYTGGQDFPYPPFFGMIFAPTALLPMPIAKAVFYPVGIAALLFLLWTQRRLVQPAFNLDERQTFWTASLAVFLAIQFIIRDQVDLGVNTGLVALTWLSIYLWRQRHDLLAGLSLGLAIAIKCTPAIFFGYFVWKRQWRMAICTALATLFFTGLPMVWQGPTSWTNHMSVWAGNVIDGISGRGFEMAENFRVRNMSLRPSMMAYLAQRPEVESRPGSDPVPLHFLNFSPMVASWLVTASLLVLLASFLWWCRGAAVTRNKPRILWELAAAGVLGLLFSPVTWTQHCVALLPACFLIAAAFVRHGLSRWQIMLLSIFVLFCSLLGRDLIGRDLSLRLASYHIPTFCILGLFLILLTGPRLQTARGGSPIRAKSDDRSSQECE
jgi:alpha-1,2-mannosyltransferase